MFEKTYRTVIYARLSKDDGDKTESNSISSQKLICEDYISKQSDLELVNTYVDDGYSGVDFNRPAFKRMEQAVREEKIDAIVVKDLSRFSRNYIDGGRYLEKIFPQLGIRFIAINDSYDTNKSNPQSDSFIIPFKNLINDTYCKDISVKVRTNLDVKRRNGEFVGAFAPYGYKKDDKDKNRLVVDEYAGDIVRQIFSMFKDGMSIGSIADRLNELGVLSPMEYKQSNGSNYETSFRMNNSAKWSYKAVQRILTNEVYIGVLVQGKRGTPNYKVHVIQDKDESEWIKVEDSHEALITYDDFLAVKTMLSRDTRSVSSDSESNIFSGFIFCADCGQPMIRKVVPSKNKKYLYYVCSSHKRHEGCSAHSISCKEVENAVMGAIKTQVSTILDISRTLEYISTMPSSDRIVFNYEKQIEKLTEEIVYCRKMKLRTYEDLSNGVIDKSEYADFRKQYTAMIDEKQETLVRIKREMKDTTINGDTERVWVSLFKQYENIQELSRRVLMSLIDKIFIYEKHGIEVSFRYGDEFSRVMEYINSYELPMAAGEV